MFRYVTLTDKNTIDKVSDNPFEGAVQVWISDTDLSTFLNTPYLCWVEKNADGSYLLHIPDDAPRPAYEQKIADFQSQLTTLSQTSTTIKAQLDAEIKKNQALIAQIRTMQAQNQAMSIQLASISADDQQKSAALDSANATIAQQSSGSGVAQSTPSNK